MQEFYFLRHGETNHNVNKIYDDVTDIELNTKGREQAFSLRNLFSKIKIKTVCSSPLKRAQQTKELIFGNACYRDLIFSELKECSSNHWRLFLKSERKSLEKEELDFINNFIMNIKHGLEAIIKEQAPLLIIAHGGTFWALCDILGIKGDRKIGNCVPIRIHNINGLWTIDRINR